MKPPESDPVRRATERPLDGTRVLVVYGGTAMHGQEWGNLEVFLALRPLGLDARFITNRQWRHLHVKPVLDRLGFECGETGLFGPLVSKRKLVRDLLKLSGYSLVSNLALWREMRRWRPTHVYCMNFLYFVNVSPLIFLLRIPVIFRLGDAPPGPYRLWKWLWRRIVARCETVVCVSEFIRTLAIESGCPPERTRVIYGTPRSGTRRSGETVAPEGSTEPIILFVGQVAEHKGVALLLQAFATIREAHPTATLWVAGHRPGANDPFKQRLESLVLSLGIAQRVRFLGYVEDVTALYPHATLHVCPTVTDEPLPNVVLEAKRAGVPSVVFPSGGIPELIEQGVDGFVCDDRSAASLAAGLRYFLDSPDRIAGAGAAARHSLEERFGRARYVEAWTRVFKDACESP